MKTVKFKVNGMTCSSCEKIIKMRAMELKGVINCTVDYVSQTGVITFDSKLISIKKILNHIEGSEYFCSVLNSKKKNNYFGLILSGISILIIIFFVYSLVERIELPNITQNMGYALIFSTGLLTGFHCIGMCGGFVLSYSAKSKNKSAHLLYGFGKTLSYTIIGAVFGLIGSVFSFTPLIRGIAGIIAGLFLLIYGLNMLNIFPILRKIRIKTPKFITGFVGKQSMKQSSPLILGLLNGLMLACGPLQAMYVMAAGTGSMIEGAKSLFFFGLGTLPIMLGFGFITSFISKTSTIKIMKASGAIVIILGLLMVNNGLALTGSGYDLKSLFASTSLNSLTGNIILDNEGYQEIRMTVDRNGWTPDTFVLKKDVPVRWIIEGVEINGCNNAIQVPSLGLEFDIIQGEQIIEFTPTEEGTVSWSCWMGMIPGVFIVTDDVESVNIESVEVPESTGGCGGSCGCGSRV